jgi:tellurite resistance protein TehA-like permease
MPGTTAAHSRQNLGDKIRQFTPNRFAMTMGNGIVFLVIAGLPWHFAGQMTLAHTSDSVLYVLFAGMLLARWIFYPETIRPMLHHPLQSMFIGAVPMGLAPVINGLVLFAGPHGGGAASQLAYGLWCVDAVLALAVAVGVPYMMFTAQDHALERITAVLLLPIVAPEVVLLIMLLLGRL